MPGKMGGDWDSWSGDDWQNYCRRLLILRYGVSYQAVPDRDQGDFGIEGYTDGGIVFQCYAAQDPMSADDLYKKQRDKITGDLGKFERNLREVRALTAPASVRYWVLLVPRCDTKRIIQHGTKKAAQLRAKRLDGVDEGFQVRVLTDEDFYEEKRQLSVAGAAFLPIPPAAVPEETAKAWQAESPEAVANLNRKVARLSTRVSTREQQHLCTELIKCHLRGSDLKERIRSAQPQMWEHLDRIRKQRERLLSLESLAATPEERRTLQEEVDTLKSRLQCEPLRLEHGLAEDLAWGIVADWLIRCPLDPLSRTAA